MFASHQSAVTLGIAVFLQPSHIRTFIETFFLGGGVLKVSIQRTKRFHQSSLHPPKVPETNK